MLRTAGRVALLIGSMVIVGATLTGIAMGLAYGIPWLVGLLPITAQGMVGLAVKVGLWVVILAACGLIGLYPQKKDRN